MGTPLNNHEFVATFQGANGVIASPDADATITWKIWDQDGTPLHTTTHTSEQWVKLDDGSYLLNYAPPLGIQGVQSVALTTIGGEPAAAWGAERIRVPGHMRPPAAAMQGA
ncbi:MAG: hypothetical protein M0R75_14965 [Dehalococcoidia bacterium]|nr:hypothetical protein [Dehalococcoidia bacterium]